MYKREVSFIDKKGNRFNLKLEITERNGYRQFTMSGDYGGGGGQIQDHIIPDNKDQKAILKIWKKWHINGTDNPLPDNFEEKLESICEFIEIYEENRFTSKKVVDYKKLDLDNEEDSKLYDAIEEASSDENSIALALHLEMTVEQLGEIVHDREGYNDLLYSAEGIQYYVGTEDEILEAMIEYVKDNAWCFNPHFLASETKLAFKVFKALGEQCESANEAVVAIIEQQSGIEGFAEAALEADGFAHFLNSYDGEGHEVEFNDTTYFICRT